MNKSYLLALALAFAPLCLNAQTEGNQPPRQEQGQPAPQAPQRLSSFEQADLLRGKLGLNDKQFSKVYNAYAKYNKAVYGGEPFQSSSTFGSAQGGRPQGGPRGGGMGGPGGGGMGGPGGGGMGGPGGGGMGGPGGGGMGGPGMGGGMDFGGDMDGERPQMDDNRPDAPKQLSQKDIEKRIKNMEKQEQKIQKTMLKVLGSDDLYNQWLEFHQTQKPQMQHPHPQPQPAEPENAPQN